MAVIRVTDTGHGLDQAIRYLEELEKRGTDVRPALEDAGNVMLGSIDRNFESEGRPTRWKKRSDITQTAMEDKAAFRYMETKRFQNTKTAKARERQLERVRSVTRGNKILQVTGDLRKSFRMRVTRSNVEVGSTLPYARIHHFGGKIRPKRAKMLRFYVGKTPVFRAEVTIPARPYMMIPPADQEQIVRVFEHHLRGGASG